MARTDDFSNDVINKSKLKAAYICSNPNCRKTTIAPSLTDEMQVQYCGKVAHITAAAAGGARYNKDITSTTRKSISNAIFLCSNCADLIDKNGGKDYSVELLKFWKKEHHKWVLGNLNKNEGSPLNQITSNNQKGGIVANTVNINAPAPEKVDTKLKHDIALYQRMNEIFNEDSFKYLTDELVDYATCGINHIHKFQKLYDFYALAGNSYLNEVVNNAKDAFVKSIPPMANYIHRYFDKWPYEQSLDNFKIQLKPEYLRTTRFRKMEVGDREKWEVLFSKLVKHVNKAKKSYRNFRLAVKSEFHI